MYGYNSFYTHFLMFYLIYGALIYVLYKASKSNKKKSCSNSLPYVLFLALPLYLLGIFRGDTVGGDLYNYLLYFDVICIKNKFADIWDVSSHEPGYRIFTYIISCISKSHRAFLIGTFTLSFIGPVYLIYKFSKMPLFSYVLYYALGFYTNTFNNVRQSIAISICFLSIGFLLNRDFRKFLLTVLFALMFHYSAVFFLFLYPLINKQITFKNVTFVLGGGIILYFAASISIVSLLLNVLAFKYDAESILASSEGKGWGLFVLFILILIGELLLFSRIKEKDSKNKVTFFIWLQIMAILCQMYAPLFSSMVRLASYFFIPIIIAIPYYACCFKKIRPIIITAGVALGILYLGKVYSKNDSTGSNSQAVIPYVFIDKKIY